MFLQQSSIHELDPFGGFLGLVSPKYYSSLLKFWLRTTSFIRQRHCLNNLSKLSILVETRHTHSWLFWSIFGSNLPPENPKYYQKPKYFSETASLWLSNNTNSRSQINHRILIKLIKINIFGDKNRFFKVKNRSVNKDQEVRGQVNTTFLETPNSGLIVCENLLL